MKNPLSSLRTFASFCWDCFVAIARLVAHRRGVPEGGAAISYGAQERALAMVMIPVGLVEALVTALVTHGTRVEPYFDAISGMLLVILLGLLAKFTVYPHVVSPEGFWVHKLGDEPIFVPMRAIAKVTSSHMTDVPFGAKDRETFDVSVKGRVDVALALSSPVLVRFQAGPVTTLRFAADASDAVAAIRRYQQSSEVLN